MRTWVMCDDNYHPASTVMAGLEPLRQAGYDFEFSLTAEDWSEDKLSDYPLLILSKSNRISAAVEGEWMTEEVERALSAYIAQGGGLLVLHSGTVGYAASEPLMKLIGGVFTHHPEQCPVTLTPVAGHPITAGLPELAPFTVRDEHYFIQQAASVSAEHFLTSSSEHGSQPAGWTLCHGKGRVCVLTPGHNLDAWLHPGYQELLHRSLAWCATGN